MKQILSPSLRDDVKVMPCVTDSGTRFNILYTGEFDYERYF